MTLILNVSFLLIRLWRHPHGLQTKLELRILGLPLKLEFSSKIPFKK